MRRIVLIDGENLVYGLRILLRTNESGEASRALIETANLKGLFNELLSDNVPTKLLWYGAHVQVYDETEELRLKSEEAVRTQTNFINLLQMHGIEFVMVGYLRARESPACEQCGHRTWHLAEKGVDVGLAVSMVTEADADTEIVVASADTDLLPAFAAAHARGAKIMHVGYEYQSSTGLSQAADITRTITLPMLQRYLAR